MMSESETSTLVISEVIVHRKVNVCLKLHLCEEQSGETLAKMRILKVEGRLRRHQRAKSIFIFCLQTRSVLVTHPSSVTLTLMS